MANKLIDIRYPNDQPTALSWSILIMVTVAGAVIRLWGLDNIGLHGDEEVMGLAARGILETGSPYLPSGMYYARALPQLYLMSASTFLFGDNEWAMRLPSVLVGTLAIFIAYFLGRRFLAVKWSIMFAAVVALLPVLISLSQTARMYAFYVTFAMLFAVMVFRWERTQSLSDLLLAIAACCASVSFHALSVFSMPLFFYPGVSRQSWRLLAYGAVAFVACVAANQVLRDWISRRYFELVEVPSRTDALPSSGTEEILIQLSIGLLIVMLAAGLTFAVSRSKKVELYEAIWKCVTVACLVASLLFAGVAQFYLSGVSLLLGLVFASRAGIGLRPLGTVVILVVVIFVVQAVLMWSSGGVDGLNRLVLELIGVPSAWPLLIFSRFAPVAVLLYVIVAMYFVVRFAKRQTLPDHVLFFLFSVFAPLFLIGFFTGYISPRYIVGFFPFFVLTAVAAIASIIEGSSIATRALRPPGLVITTAILLALFVRPAALWHNVNPQYSGFPSLYGSRAVDHKGAAEFVMSSRLGADDLVLAVDAQVQGYYLGSRLDYYLRSLIDTRNSTFLRDGEMLNLYTGTPQIATGQDLERLITEQATGRVLLIGSGVIESNPQRYMGDGILEVIQQYEFREVYQGRDGATTVWQYSASSQQEEGLE